MTTKRIYDFQLSDTLSGKSIRDAGGVCYVTSVNGNAKLVLTDPDNDFAVLANPVPLVNGRIRFATEKAIEAVDLYLQAPGGHFAVVPDKAAGGAMEIFLDTGRLQQTYVIPFSITDTTAAVETDTGFDLPLDAVVLGDGAGVNVDAIDGTETIDVGILASESGGDANGFMALLALGVAGFIKATGIATATFGALLVESFATTPAVNVAGRHRGDGVAESISYTLTAGTDTAEGKIVLPVLLANI